MTLLFTITPINILKKTILGIFLSCLINTVSAQESNFLVLNYHDIIDNKSAVEDAVDLSQKHFEEQLQWLKTNNYQVISVQQVFDAAAGKFSLPKKAVVLTFDDGYQSFYTRVLPLLKKYRYPATVSLVGSWMDEGTDEDEPKKPLSVQAHWDLVWLLVAK